MLASTMNILAGVLVLGSFAGVAVAHDPFSESVSTETLPPQDLGAMSTGGALVYQLKICSVVHSTRCQLAVSTAGGPPPLPPPTASPPPANERFSSPPTHERFPVPHGGERFPAPSAIQRFPSLPAPLSYSSTSLDAETSAAEPLVESVPGKPDVLSTITATGAVHRPTTLTRFNLTGPTEAGSIPTGGYMPSSTTDTPIPNSTGASNTLSVVRGVAIGAGAMAVAFLF
ncbi:hypothetical protein HIM_02799 [Hirsutella minnesotensis 3608]|nr:hypothetical protein HIM_02799 [Hirsutella minnesotensis 3608]